MDTLTAGTNTFQAVNTGSATGTGLFAIRHIWCHPAVTAIAANVNTMWTAWTSEVAKAEGRVPGAGRPVPTSESAE